MNTPIFNRRVMLLKAAASLGLAGPAAAAPKSCYRRMGAAPPAATGTTIFFCDTTTVSDRQVTKSLDALALRALQTPGERVLVCSFAAMAPGQFPTVVADVRQEPEPTTAQVEANVLDWTTGMKNCLGHLRRVNTVQIRQALHSIIAKDVNAPYSEIVAGLRWLLQELVPSVSGGQRTRIVVYSDGEQNSRTGMSFYRAGLPREFTAKQELAKIESAERGNIVPHSADVEVWWLGVGLQPPGVKLYVTPKAIEERKLFWAGIASLFGAKRSRIGFALADDGF